MEFAKQCEKQKGTNTRNKQMKKVRKSEGTENELGVRGRVGSGHPEAET